MQCHLFTVQARRFGQFLKKPSEATARSLPEQYKTFMLMDILHLSKAEIADLSFLEHRAAVNYAITSYQLKYQLHDTTRKSKPSRTSKPITFNQDPDFDVDPNFSKVPPR